MAKKAVTPVTWRAQGVTDALDGSSVFDGAMAALTNLIFNPKQAANLVCRPAAAQLSNFSGFTTPGIPSALLVVGQYAVGFVPSGRFAGKDEPFVYDILNGVFITLANVTAANCPTSQASTGDWTPPTIAMITNGRFAITHPGYDGINNFVGWVDISQANLTGLTGATHSSTTIDGISSNPIIAGWAVGMKIAGAGIPANTYITNIVAPAGGPYSITLSQAATATASGVALTVTGGSLAAPLYGAGNLTGNPLSGSPATSVALYSGRAWYAWKNYAIYSDSLNPTQVTNANQALQIGDNVAITALAGLPLTSQVNGGTLQSLIVFKGAGNMTQITGDAATANLNVNTVNGSVGTLAPNTICATPQGLCYVAPDGVRIMGLDGTVRQPIGEHGEGVCVPLSQALFPTRMCAAFNNQVLRVTCQNSQLPGAPFQEWWYHFDLDRWTGPHTSTNALIRPYYGSFIGPFIHAMVGVSGALFSSYSEPNNSVSYTENGVPLTWTWQSLLTPDNGAMAMNNLQGQSTISVALPSGQTLTITLMNENSQALDTYTITAPPITPAIWGSFNWGSKNWGASVQALQQLSIAWSKPEVFKQAQILINGASQASFILGDLRGNIEALGYALL